MMRVALLALSLFAMVSAGKRSLCVDLAKPEAVDLLRALAAKVDVVVENFGPGVLDKRGLGYERLREQNPGLIMASVSAFGRSGPLAGKIGFDLMAQAFSGLCHMTGEPNGPPQFVHMGIADVASGVHAFGAVAAALFHKSRTGRGQAIDVALVDSLYHMHEVNVQVFVNGGGAYVASIADRRAGSRYWSSTGNGPRWSRRSAGQSSPPTRASRAMRYAARTAPS